MNEEEALARLDAFAQANVFMGMAIGTSYVAHMGQKYGQEDYFATHPKRVAESSVDLYSKNKHALDTIDSMNMFVLSCLHDVVEDTKLELSDILDLFGVYVAHRISLLTMVEGDTREEYLEAILQDKLATIVKYLDMRNNISNLGAVEDLQRRSRMETKYNKEFPLLEDALTNKYGLRLL